MTDTFKSNATDELRRLVDRLPSMIAYWDRDLRCRFANRAHRHWFGVEPDALIGTRIEDLLGPALFATHEPFIRAALSGSEQAVEESVVQPDGRPRHSLVVYAPDQVDGEIRGIVVQVTEITPQKQAEIALRAECAARERAVEQLQRSEDTLREAQRLGQIGSWEWEISTDITTWSEELYRIYGRDPTRLPPNYAEHPQLYSAESWARLSAAVERALATGEPYRLELEYRRPDGATGWVEGRGEAVRDADGRIVALHGVAQEITLRRSVREARAERDAARAESQAQRERALLATEAGGMGLWQWDPADDRVVWENDRPLDLLGIVDRDRALTAAQFVDEFIHVDDVAAFRQASSHALRHGDFRFTGKDLPPADRHMRWVTFRGAATRRPGATAQVFIGTLTDVTEQKQAEARERLRTSQATAAAQANARFRAFFEQCSFFGGVLGLDGTVLEINRQCLEASGFARSDFIGRKFWDCDVWGSSTPPGHGPRCHWRGRRRHAVSRRDSRISWPTAPNASAASSSPRSPTPKAGSCSSPGRHRHHRPARHRCRATPHHREAGTDRAASRCFHGDRGP